MQVITSGAAGGAQSHLGALCDALSNRVKLFAAIGSHDGRSALGDRLSAFGVTTAHVPALRNSINPLHLRRASGELADLIRTWQPDAVHAHSSFAGAAARVAAHRCGVPVVYTVHGFGFKPEARLLVREVACVTEALLAPWTDCMICVSAHEAALARRLPLAPRTISVIPNGLPDVPWRAKPDGSCADLVTVARLAPPKRVDLLLDALSLVPQWPMVRIIGDGPLRERLEARARTLDPRRRVEFTGEVDDVPQRLADHGVFALLSDHEGMPISVLEAMRAGLAIVATRLPGVEEMVMHDESALLVRNEAGAVRDALARLFADSGLRARLGRAARARYERDFDASTMAERVLEVYRAAVGLGK